MQVPRILLVEDDESTRERFARVLAADARVVLTGSAASLAAGRDALEALAPDVLITDLDLPDGSGLELIRMISSLGFETLSLVITVFGDERSVTQALEAGALGYLLKDGTADYIVRSTLELVSGGSPISPQIARYLLRRFHADEPPAPPALDAPHLSQRETEVLEYLAKGFTYAECAQYLGVTSHTVATYVRRIYRKLAVRSRAEAVFEARQLGLLRDS